MLCPEGTICHVFLDDLSLIDIITRIIKSDNVWMFLLVDTLFLSRQLVPSQTDNIEFRWPELSHVYLEFLSALSEFLNFNVNVYILRCISTHFCQEGNWQYVVRAVYWFEIWDLRFEIFIMEWLCEETIYTIQKKFATPWPVNYSNMKESSVL